MIKLFALAAMFATQSAASDDVSMRDRALITAKMYSAVDSYFGHLSAVPKFKLETEFPKFLDKAFAAKGRYEFDLACLEFIASLKNSHSGFNDRWLNNYNGESFGFTLRCVEDQWVIDYSRIPEVKVGDVIKEIDKQSFEDFYLSKAKYIAGSSDRDCRNRFSWQRYLFPRDFTLTKADGSTVQIKRIPFINRTPLKTEGRWIEPNSVAYIKVPSFDQPVYEEDALKLVKEYQSAKSLIIDVRQNGGGSTPSKLIDSLMDREYVTGAFTTPQTIAAFRVWGAYATEMEKDPKSVKDADFGELRAVRDLGYGYYYSPPTRKPQPENGFKGKVIVLIDRGTFSAGEDFCIPLKGNNRATFIGEATGGSTGQPYMVEFPNGMNFRVSTKRDTFPDGSQFEGVGVKPDILMPMTIAGIKSGQDAVLAKAVELAKAKS